ncbi:MAG: MFS transporter [Chloroflexi bacterium]|nr:MFS transporter [Chloroflexota bacterium]
MLQEKAMMNDKREIFGWAMYDWANSAFSTTVGTVFLAPYVASLAADAAKADFLIKNGVDWNGAIHPPLLANLFGIPVAPDSFMGYCISISVLLQVFFLPILGAIADYSHLRKQMMQVFATIGAAATILMFFITGPIWWMGGLLFIAANLAFGASIIFYNAYLPDIASEDQRDRVSSFGWAMGYLGDGILLALNLALFLLHDKIGIPTGLAIRINLASAGIWWLSWSFLTWARLRPRHARRPLPSNETYFSVGFRQLGKTIKEVRNFPETLKYLFAYFLYNDGIQTVIAMSSTFAAAPLIRGGLELSTSTLTEVILLIQFVAFFGALFWGRLAGWVGAKRSIIISLVIWAGVVIYAYFGMKGDNRATEFMLLGVVIALVLGGSQAISRSLFAQMIPNGKEAEYYSFYEVSDKGTSWIGPALFAIVNQAFGNLRPAILSLIFLFVMGLIILPFLNEKKAIEDVKKYEPVQS